MADAEDEAQALRSQIKTLAEQGRHAELAVAISRMRLVPFLRELSACSGSAPDFYSVLPVMHPKPNVSQPWPIWRTNLDLHLPGNL